MIESSAAETRRANVVLGSLALLYFLMQWIPSFLGTYGYFIDELYYIACSDRLAFGYVDHPSVSIVLLRLIRVLIGDSLPAMRLVPALAGAATIFVTGILARRLGAGLFGQALAAGAAMTGSIYLVMFSFYSMNSISLLLWAVCFWILVEIEGRNEPRLWVAFGAVAGLALENKHTIVLLAGGLAVGLVLAPARRHLASRWLWIGLGIAVLILVPNLIWQQANGWPSLEFYRNADLYKNNPTPPMEVLKQQILFMNPAAMPIWLGGSIFLLATRRGRPYRHLGWLFAALFLLMVVSQKSRPDRIAGAYMIVLAAGGVLMEDLSRRGRGRWIKVALPAALILSGAALAPLGIPFLPPGVTASYATTLGIVPQIERGEGKRTDLPQWLADRFGWEQFVDDVEEVVSTLDPSERTHAIILAPSYGQAGALELFGRGRNLPPVYATQNNYWLWGPPDDSVQVAVVAGFGEENIRELFQKVDLARTHDCDWCMRWRDLMPIYIARRPKQPFREIWARAKNFI